MFIIKPSKTYLLMLFVVHLAAFVTVCLTNLVVWARFCLALLIAASLFYQLYRYWHTRWRSFFLDQRQLQVNTRSGETRQGSILHQTLVTPCCVVLCARLDGYRRPVCQVIFRDAMQAEALRELRVRLRFF